jgi:hypothetical protein
MKLFPVSRETLILPYSADEVELMLWPVIDPVIESDEVPDREEDEFLFTGWIKDRKFKISRKIRQAEFALPIISGLIEGTSKGSIVFTVYKLFPATILLLTFWSILTLLLFLYFLIVEQAYYPAIIAIGLCIANYFIVITNFNIQASRSRSLLKKVLGVAS